MKILYLANIRLPTDKAHGLQIMHTCNALASLGHEVRLVIPSRALVDEQDEQSIFKYYNLQKNFTIQRIFGMRLIRSGRVGFVFGAMVFAVSASRIIRSGHYDAIYTREEILVRKGVFYEMHDVRKSMFQRRALMRARGVVTITQGLAEYCYSMRAVKDKVVVVPDGVDADEFEVIQSKEECRTKLGLPSDKKIILYTGHLYFWKGVDTLAESAQFFDENTLIVFVGGTDHDVKSFMKRFTSARIVMVGHKPHNLIPYYLKSADVLVLPNSAKEDISRLYTSPIKLFEYMSSGRPIIASDLPSLQEVLNDKNAIFFNADNPVSLAETIKKVLANPSATDIITTQALSDVKEYTWEKRAQKIINFIQQ